MDKKTKILKETFKFDSFRGKQAEIIDYINSKAKTESVVVMPTGAGKSLLFQIPALMSENITLVISPLISLMNDQVNHLRGLGIGAECVHSDLPKQTAKANMRRIMSGKSKLLYISPEKACSSKFISFLSRFKIDIIAIDEAHCISQWGHDFRPSYKKLGLLLKGLSPKKTIALTATATEEVVDDIKATLNINGEVFVTGFYRPDLRVSTKYFTSMDLCSQTDFILDYCDDEVSGIVYTITKKDAFNISKNLKKFGVNTFCYHSEIKKEEKERIGVSWKKDGGVVVATTAFGMGIDKPNVRFVINMGLPSSVEEWYQMIGRASRDGQGADCILCYSKKDLWMRNHLVSLSLPEWKDLRFFINWVERKTRNGNVKIKMTQKKMAKEAGVNDFVCGGCCSQIIRAGAMEKIKNSEYILKKKPIVIDKYEYERARKDKIDKFMRVFNYAKDNNVCRMRQFCGYFGEKIDNVCGTCDNCL